MEEDYTAGAWGLRDDMESSEMDRTKLIDSFIVLRFKHEPLAWATGQPCLTYDNKLDWNLIDRKEQQKQQQQQLYYYAHIYNFAKI